MEQCDVTRSLPFQSFRHENRGIIFLRNFGSDVTGQKKSCLNPKV